MDNAKLDHYVTEGYLVVDPVIGAAEIDALLDGATDAAAARPEATLCNTGDSSLRIVYGVHDRAEVHARLVRVPAILDCARQLLGGEVYVHQTKVTLNTPMTGEGWPWHQDYAFWSTRDHLPRPDVLSAAVLLDDMSVVNGPLLMVPRSHRADVPRTADGVLGADQISDLCHRNGIVPTTAPAGSVVYFDGNVVHGSSPNVTPFARRVLYITYNRVDNVPRHDDGAEPPDYVCSRDTAALTPLRPDEPLLTVAA